jgi:Holliday junction DNA helicase RuvA
VLVVREDALSLYGFAEPAERAIFLKLIGVSGVGPKTALNALSGLTVEALVAAIRDGNVGELTRLHGIGRKIAERICLELKEAMAGFDTRPGPPRSAPERDAVEALVSLGYHRPAAVDAVRRALAEAGKNATVEDLVRRALAALGTGTR